MAHFNDRSCQFQVPVLIILGPPGDSSQLSPCRLWCFKSQPNLTPCFPSSSATPSMKMTLQVYAILLPLTFAFSLTNRFKRNVRLPPFSSLIPFLSTHCYHPYLAAPTVRKYGHFLIYRRHPLHHAGTPLADYPA